MTTTLDNSYNYNDLAQLNAINKLGQKSEAKALKEVARQFESMFISMMLKSMRDANAVFEQDNPLNSNESQFYRQMLDEQMALTMSSGKGIGLSESIFEQLKSQFHIEDESDQSKEMSFDVAGARKYLGQPANPFNAFEKVPTDKTDHQDQTARDQANSLSNELAFETTSSTSEASVTHSRNKASGFESPQDFVNALWPVAQDIGKQMGVEPKAILAQAALETGWGKHIIHDEQGNNSHNLFGIKADHRWNGSSAEVMTLEYRDGVPLKEKAPFRAYESYEESLKDYARFVGESERYQSAVENGHSIKQYSEGLQQGGYATDPRYAQKIQRIASGEMLNAAIKLAPRG